MDITTSRDQDQRVCLECGQVLRGRSDQKFCSDLCRNAYNNRLNSDTSKQVRRINNILRRNRRILRGLNPDGKRKIHKSKMTQKGFDFDYFTSIYTTKTGNVYYFVYEEGYLPLDDDYYALVRREN